MCFILYMSTDKLILSFKGLKKDGVVSMLKRIILDTLYSATH